MTVEIIPWSISTKVWDGDGIKLVTPGCAVRLASVVRHITDCATRPGRTVIKYFCKKGLPPKEIHEDFMETLGKESPYSTVKKWAAEFNGWGGGECWGLWMVWPPREVGISFVAVQSILTNILDKWKVSARWVLRMLTDDGGGGGGGGGECWGLWMVWPPREVGISFVAVQSILTNILDKWKVSARWVLRMLTDD